MKHTKPYSFDPFSVMSYHDLSQEARRLRRANRKLRRAIRRLSEEEDGDCAEFVLRNAPPKPEPWRGNEPENTRQTLLIAGMDCLAGQQDLFETDGEAARTSEDK